MLRRSRAASWVLSLLAVGVLPFALVSGWVAGVVTDTDRYTSTVSPLAENPVVVDAVPERLEELALGVINLDQREQQLQDLLADRDLDPRLREAFSALGGVVRGGVTSGVRDAVDRVGVHDPQFADAWAHANRSAHEQLAVLAVAAVVVAGNRRTAVRILAYGALVTMVLLAVGLQFARRQVVGDVATGQGAVLGEVWTMLLGGIRVAVRVVLVAALGALAGLWVSGPSRLATRGRELASGAGGTTVDVIGGTARAVVVVAVVLVASVWLP